MKRAFIVGIALLVASCATIKNPITNNQLGGVIDGYGIADSAFLAYRGLPRCTIFDNFSITHICRKRSVLVAGQQLDAKVNKAINDAVRFQRANPSLDASSFVQAAQTALDEFKAFETTNGVK